MSLGVKKLLKILVKLLICLFTNSHELFAAEAPDIVVTKEIPELILVNTNFTISPDTLKFCRLIMYTIPMDPFSSNKEWNSRSPIPITQVVDIKYAYHPLQLFSNRELLKTYFGGRNVVITQDKTMRHVMVATGMGPKYDSFRKEKIENSIGVSIVDIIDVLPGIDEGQRTNIRNFFIHYRNVLELLSILSRDINENSFQKIQNLMAEDPIINEILTKSDKIRNFEEILSKNPSAILTISKSANEIAHLNTILQNREIQEYSSMFINKLMELVQSHSAQQKETALAELEKISKKIQDEPEYCYELIYQITALDEGTISSSLTGLKLIDPVERGHPQALGDLFHSEPLYLLWRTEHHNAAPYFFTQRDMCPVCDLHICHNAIINKIPYITVLSAKAGNAKGAASIDKILHLNKVDLSWQPQEMLPLKDSTLFQSVNGITSRLREKQKTDLIKKQQSLKIERLRLPDLYIE